MKKAKKILLTAGAYLLTAALAIGGTVAYLTSDDSDVNVMTLGNVKIEQHEYERVVDENGKWVSTGETDKYGYTPDKIQEFTQAKPLFPAVFADGNIKWDDRNGSQDASGTTSHQQSWAQVGASGSNQLFDDSVKNVQDKFVFVENTGKSDAYVRTWFAFEQGKIAAENFENVIMTNINKGHWSWETVATDVEIDGNKYVVTCATYLGPKSNPTGVLAPEVVSYPSLLQVYMKPEATNDDVKAIDGNSNGNYDILVFSQAVQTAGFEDAKTALDTAFGVEIPWKTQFAYEVPAMNSNNEVELNKDLILLEESLHNDSTATDSYSFEGNGHTVVMKDTKGEIDSTGTIPQSAIVFSSKNGELVTVKDVTITGTFQMVTAGHYTKKPNLVKHNTLFENVHIKDADIVYFSNRPFTSALCVYGNLTMNNCSITGSKLSLSGVQGKDIYDACFTNGSKTTINGGEFGSLYLDNQAHVTINNAKVDSITSCAITTKNLGKLTVGAGAKVGTITLTPGTYTPALTIEEGAEVGAIVYNGTTYTVEQWNNR